MTAWIAILALRGAAAVLVLTTLTGGIPRVAQAALVVATGLWTALVVVPFNLAAPTVDVAIIAAVRELVIGAALGVAASLPLVAAAAAGKLVDLRAFAGGRGPYAPLFGILAAAVFVGIDGHVMVVGAIVDSFRHAPAVGDVKASVLAAIVALIPAAVRLAIPWLITAAVVELAIGAGVRAAGRAAAASPTAAAVPAALAMMTAALISTFAVTVAQAIRAFAG